MIELRNLTKHFGKTVAVDDLTVTVAPGRVTGFLGPNGAGKSTTMRLILGLDRPTSGTVTINGRTFHEHHRALTEVGALLEAKSFHPARSAYNHLLWLAQSNGLPRKRVHEVIERVGLGTAAKRRAGGFSLGMAQRLGIAAALLGDPPILLFDEPVNGLDPEGIQWIRKLLRSLAAEGRTIFVSSHLMSEMSLTADHLIVIGRGKLIADTSVKDFIASSTHTSVRVRAPELKNFPQVLAEQNATVKTEADGSLSVSGLAIGTVGELAFDAGVILHELTPLQGSLEEAFMELTHGKGEFAAHDDGEPASEGTSGQGDTTNE